MLNAREITALITAGCEYIKNHKPDETTNNILTGIGQLCEIQAKLVRDEYETLEKEIKELWN